MVDSSTLTIGSGNLTSDGYLRLSSANASMIQWRHHATASVDVIAPSPA
jgi:hypothetical protein